MEEIPLSSLFHRALTTASKALNLPTIEDETQVSEVLHSHLVSYADSTSNRSSYNHL